MKVDFYDFIQKKLYFFSVLSVCYLITND